MDDYEKYSAEAAEVSLSQFHTQEFIRFLEGDITAQDIADDYNNEEQREFWEDFRFRYAEYGDDRETMLEALKREEKDSTGKTERDRKDRADGLRPGKRGRESGPQEHPGKKTPLPEPEVPRGRRGRGHTPRESTNAVARALGRIGRWFTGRNK